MGRKKKQVLGAEVEPVIEGGEETPDSASDAIAEALSPENEEQSVVVETPSVPEIPGKYRKFH